MVEPVTTTALVIKGMCWLCTTLGVSYCAKKAHDAYSKHSKRQKERLALKGKSLETAKEDNKQAQIEENEWKKKYDDVVKREEKRNQEIENIKDKLKDPNLSDKKRGELEEKLASLLAQQDDDKKEKDKILTKLKQLGDRIKNNNKIISGVGLNTDDKHWIWDLVTLENILVVAGIYVAYRILKDEDKK